MMGGAFWLALIFGFSAIIGGAAYDDIVAISSGFLLGIVSLVIAYFGGRGAYR